MKSIKAILAAIVIVGLGPIVALAQPADDVYWTDEFKEAIGTNNRVFDMVTFGDRLVVAGRFTQAGAKDILQVAAWDGWRWSEVATNSLDGTVFDLHVFNGKLYAGGKFSIGVGGGDENLAVLQGDHWEWVDGKANDTVFVVTDCAGYLTIGGAFTDVTGCAGKKAAYYDGNTWHRMGTTIDGTVLDIEELNGTIYAAGDFQYLSDGEGYIERVNSMVWWNGSDWKRLSHYLGMLGSGEVRVNDLMVRGGELVATGEFDKALLDGTLNNIGAWDGSSWSAFGSGIEVGYQVGDFDGSLVASVRGSLMRWSGTDWVEMLELESGLFADAIHEHTNVHYVSGPFVECQGKTVNYIAAFGSAYASPLRTGFNGSVRDIELFQGKLAIGGTFSRTADSKAYRTAFYDGDNWEQAGALVHPGLDQGPRDLLVHNDTLYAAGAFGTSTSFHTYHLMRFDGVEWGYFGLPTSVFPDGLSYPVRAAISFGDYMVMGGYFTSPMTFMYAIGPPGYTNLGASPTGTVESFCDYDGDLVVGGLFAACGVLAQSIASWDGSAWSAFGSGINGTVYAVELFEGYLIAGGDFDSAGGVAANNVATWNGVSWSPLGDGVDGVVNALEVFDNGLIVGGDFSSAGGSAASSVARWYQAVWSPLGSGVDGVVYTLLADDTVLYVGGDFEHAGGKSTPNFARWEKYLGLPTGIEDEPGESPLPQDFTLSPNYPNPFNPATRIDYSLPERGRVRIDVLNMLGQRVTTLVDRVQAAGSYSVTWNGTDDSGSQVATGVYFYRLEAGERIESRKMILLK